MGMVIKHLLRMGYPLEDVMAVVLTNGPTAALKKFGMHR